jgi:hypothetical protein
MDAHILDEEVKTYAAAKPGLLKTNLGEYVAVKNQDVMTGYSTLLEAYEAGLNKWGYVPMLIKKVELEEPIEMCPTIFTFEE